MPLHNFTFSPKRGSGNQANFITPDAHQKLSRVRFPARLQARPIADIGMPSADPIEVLQLRRLAQAVLSKDRTDLTALAKTNPQLIAEWQNAFRQQRVAAEKSALFWASASASLASLKGFGDQ